MCTLHLDLQRGTAGKSQGPARRPGFYPRLLGSRNGRSLPLEGILPRSYWKYELTYPISTTRAQRGVILRARQASRRSPGEKEDNVFHLTPSDRKYGSYVQCHDIVRRDNARERHEQGGRDPSPKLQHPVQCRLWLLSNWLLSKRKKKVTIDYYEWAGSFSECRFIA